MPGYDRTGPAGSGPGTGRRLGDCYDFPGRRLLGDRLRWGAGFRRGGRSTRGRFRGRLFGRGMGPGPAPWAYGNNPRYYEDCQEELSSENEQEMELKMLNEEAEYLEKELEYIKRKMEALKPFRSKEEE